MKPRIETLLTWGIFASFTEDKLAQENGYHGAHDTEQFELVLPDHVQVKIYELITEHLDQAECLGLPSDMPYIFE